MKTTLIILSLGFVLMSCDGEGAENTEEVTSEELNAEEDSALVIEKQPFQEASFTIDVDLEGLDYTGEKVFACSWLDAHGENIVINTEHATDWAGDVRSAYLYSYHYVRNDTGTYLLRLVQDNYEDCDFDVSANFRCEPYISDVNGDDYAEVTVCYELGCRSDVSENDMKVIMHDQESKYGLRGAEYIIFPDEEVDESKFNPNQEEYDAAEQDEPEWFIYRGRYKNDNDFDAAPNGYLEHANMVWMSNVFTRF